ILVIFAFLTTTLCPLANAQYMYLDTDGDGVKTAGDELPAQGSGHVDVWVQTDMGRGGERTSLRDQAGDAPSINSYEFILRATGGTVSWGRFTNLQPSMTYPFGPRQSATDYWIGYGGLESLPAGKYKLGRLEFRIDSGTPSLQIVSSSSLWGGAHTSFGSKCLGYNYDNTLKLAGPATSSGSYKPENEGDWIDADGLDAGSTKLAQEALHGASSVVRFEVKISANPWIEQGEIHLRTTRSGFARVRLFDSTGRLIRTILNNPSLGSGDHVIRVDWSGRGVASGVYFYRVETPEASQTGRIVFLGR
ncbi:MAG: T9SS type A sorting domain-containing protein, partial [bacterium]